jgi:anti-sigma factor ChrR (cupin superfamily)
MTTNDPLDPDPADLAALYAAGALAGDELAAVERLLVEGCAAVENEVRSYDAVIAALAGAVSPVAPDPRVRAELLRRVAARKSAPAPRPPAGLFILRSEEGSWEDIGVPGVRRRVLFVDSARGWITALIRMAPGTSFPGHPHPGAEECLVLEGDLHVGDLVLRAGDYQRAEAGTEHEEQSTEDGCLLLVTAPVEEFAG